MTVIGGSVPLIILLGWSVNLYLFLSTGKTVVQFIYQKQTILQCILISFVASLFGICLDLLEDPLAYHNGWWIWTESTTGLRIFDVPFSNFMDWGIILFMMSFATLLIERSQFDENRKIALSFTSIPLIILSIYATHLVFMTFFTAIGFI